MTTKVIKISPQSPDFSLLTEAAEAIRSGRLVVFPTETVYGIGADATRSEAVAKIFEAKGRPQDNPLIIHIAAISDADKYTYTNELYYRLAEAFMPGPLTVVLRSKDNIPEATRAGLPTVAVRCPENPIARELIRLSGCPIAAPSANLSGSPSPTSAEHVIKDMLGRCDVIIDGGDCDFGLESTIVKLDDDGGVTLLRPGKITVSDIESLGIDVRVADAVRNKLVEGSVALSPGMKYRHYAPKAEVLLLNGDITAFSSYVKGYRAERKAVIAYSEDIPRVAEMNPDAHVYDFGSQGNVEAQAHALFRILRDVDEQNFDVVFAPLPKDEGIGLALYNRMIRAAAYKIIKL